MNFPRHTLSALLLCGLLLLIANAPAQAGSATWNLNPTSGDWNTAANWTPATVPNGPDDVATFAHSNVKAISLPSLSATILDGLVFEAVVSEFTTTIAPDASLVFSGSGVTNNSTKIQEFFIQGGIGAGAGSISFLNNARSGTNMYYTIYDGIPVASMTFSENSVSEGFLQNRGGQVDFFDTASAPGGMICFGGETVDENPGIAIFHDHSVSGGVSPYFGFNGGPPGVVYFNDDSICDDGYFYPQGGRIDLSGHNPPGLGCAGLLGYGLVYLGSNNLRVGSGSTSDTYRGTILDGGSSGGNRGSLTKVGAGDMTLSPDGDSTYSGGTVIESGTLLVENKEVFATGYGPVQVNGGELGGNGTIAGVVTIGTGTGQKASLVPGKPGEHSRAPLTIRRTLTFASDATYHVRVNTNRTLVTRVVAKGITIITGAQFILTEFRHSVITPGTILTVIGNTAATPIAGTFANLPDDGTITVGHNTYQADYQGGDGNDLTLTVVP